jgi:hypothetical protein
MPFVVIETSDPARTAVIPLDGPEPISVAEVCRAGTLAELMNRIEDEELRRMRSRRRPDDQRPADAPVIVTRQPERA